MSYPSNLIAIALTRQPYIPGLKALGFTAEIRKRPPRVISSTISHRAVGVSRVLWGEGLEVSMRV